jgi:O-antigen ligase
VIVHLLVLSALIVAGVALFAGAGLVEALGRDSTLTGRTDLWKLLLSVNQNPWLGAGFESFWLGDRLHRIWDMLPWRANEAHNGYLEVYLNLGLIGLAVLVVVITTGYKRVILGLRHDPSLGSLRLGYFVATIVYSFTEAAFREMGPTWILFIWAIVAVKSDPVSLDTVWTTMTAAKEAGHEGQGAKAHDDSWQ